MGYIAAYLLPFLTVDYKDPGSVTCIVVFVLMLGALYITSNMIHINPLLTLCGYHIYQVESTEGKSSLLVTRRTYVGQKMSIRVVSLGDYALMEKNYGPNRDAS